jgi:hypothetical protein
LRHSTLETGEAEEPVDDAARLLGVDQAVVDVAPVRDRVVDRRAGDLVEHHALHRHLRLELLEEVPADGLTLAILIGREEELVRRLQRRLQLPDDVLLVLVDDVGRFEAVVHIDAEPFGGQVTDVADRRLDDEIVAQEPGDGAGLGWGFDNHEGFDAGQVSDEAVKRR